MNRRKTFTTAALIVAAVLLLLFVAVGIPFIQATFTPPILGLPTLNPASSPISLKDRYTQTALAIKSAPANNATATPLAASQ